MYYIYKYAYPYNIFSFKNYLLKKLRNREQLFTISELEIYLFSPR